MSITHREHCMDTGIHFENMYVLDAAPRYLIIVYAEDGMSQPSLCVHQQIAEPTEGIYTSAQKPT